MQSRPEVWGGIECSINRVHETFQDQNELSGFYTRDNDIELCASLGFKAFRYPVLWEHHQPSLHDKIQWHKAEKDLNYLRSNNITPITGLLHHGSGPLFTNLAQHNFPELLASYAFDVAKKFPWIDHYTIINEPLTTSRFSGLYGIWYPHHKDDLSFAIIFLNQMKGIVLSMQAIRKINPYARLIQTEDMGKVYSTALLNYQAEFENERRWVTFDILTGKLIPGCVMWEYFIWVGIDESDLYFFLENKCAPEIIGLNYYITSERFLDDDIARYPVSAHGGNLKHSYSDIEAVRVDHPFESGLGLLAEETWRRYNIPIAFTEVHLNCHREQQMLWFKEIWNIATELNNINIPVKGVTAWSLFGAFGWDHLLRDISNYESGAFDIRSGYPRATALSKVISGYANGKEYLHPLSNATSWWKNDNRFCSSYHE